LAAERRWPSPLAAKWVKQFVEQVCRAPGTLALVLVGSLARPTHDPSDVDLLYVYEGNSLTLNDHPIDVDIRAYSKEDFASHLANRHGIITWALRFGRLICQRDVFWSELISSFGSNLPMPSAEAANDRAQRAAKLYDQLIHIGDYDAALEQRITLLTHRAWAHLLNKRIHPASRPELPQQLSAAGEATLGGDLAVALRERTTAKHAAPQRRAG
jgi:hypothetical protein